MVGVSIEQMIFGKKLSRREKRQVNSDIRHIKFLYFRNRGFRNIIHLNRYRILRAFRDSAETAFWNHEKLTIANWKEFVATIDEEGVEFLEFHAWL